MKKVLLIVFLLVGCSNSSFTYLVKDIQRLDAPLTKEQMSYQIIVDMDKSREEVYDLALEWMMKTFVSSKSVIQYQDKTSGKIIGMSQVTLNVDKKKKNKYSTHISFPITCQFTLSIEIKEDRYHLLFAKYSKGKYRAPFAGVYKYELDIIKNLNIEFDKVSHSLDLFINDTN